jgi:hypothetical protein
MRVSFGNPFRHLDSAVKLSVLAGRLEKPFPAFHLQVLALCFRGDLSEKTFISRFEKRKGIHFWHVGGIGRFLLEMDASSIPYCV